ncbi:TonB-dependent receptor [Spirosoma montaniterrae]|uniref:TonB-dependent receptor n=1 Tax=Spirosoma montaniterrae TaxID=1178516 RepID=A0A1P9WYN8_9BACT|nr:TonB-dependent receptor [Spirosoma montaniterrae]AQG80495.1 TonB-dependent receptor [Spirosoma montaniterrae]
MKLISFVVALAMTLATALPGLGQSRQVSGVVRDAQTGQSLAGASVTVRGTATGTATDAGGRFTITTTKQGKLTLAVSMVGQETQTVSVNADSKPLTVSLQRAENQLNDVVVAASRVEESILRSPVSIEKLDARAVQRSAAPNYFEALNNLKGVDMVTSGLTYRQINTRGFNSTGNTRFLQLIDGMDNQSPGLGWAVANQYGTSDLDLESAELIPGAASALYGPVAFNGLLYIRTKNPFQHQGLSVQQKVGVNHVNDPTGDSPKPYTETAVRYAKVIGNRLAFKVNASYLKGRDWYAADYTDIDPNTNPELRGATNPGRNALNIYGDEVAQTLPGIGRVSRTGYREIDLTNYDVYSLKLGGAVHYRIGKQTELIYALNFGQATTNYTGSSRFMLNDFQLTQHRLELQGKNFFVRAYSTAENSQNSYNTRSLGQLINRTWVRDLNGNVVTPDKADATWFARYAAAFNGQVSGQTARNHDMARAFADQGRLLPGSTDFDREKQRYIGIAGLQGAGVLSKSKLYHVEGLYDFTSALKFMSVQAGGNVRYYDMNSEGTLFDDKVNKIRVAEYGAFAQASKTLLQDKLKLTVSGRYDKNQNFVGNFTPRASAVFSPSDAHHFRASYQTGFRNPTVPDQYIRLNVGPIIILGAAPDNTAGLNAYENSFTAASVGAFGAAFGQAVGSGTPFQQALMANKDKLVKSDVPRIRAEQSQSFEVGYKGMLTSRLLFDVSYYYGQYRNFLVNQVVIRPNSAVLLPDGTVNPAAAADILTAANRQAFQLYTNAADRVSADGVSAGLTALLNRGYRVEANGTWARFNIMDANPNNIPAFNTPCFKSNVILSNDRLTNRLGFSVAWHWQEAFDWFGTFTENRPGRIPSYSLVDAQASYRMPALKTILKVGGSNLFNNYVVQAYGSAAVGGLYYVSLTFDQGLK